MVRKIFIIILTFFICFLAGQMLSSVIGILTKFNVSDLQSIKPEMIREINIFKLLQAVSSILTFIIPPFVIAKLLENDTFDFLKLNRTPNATYYILVFIFMIALMPLLNLIIQWNNDIVFPSWMQGIENYMRKMENENMYITNIMLTGTSWSTLFINLVVMAIIPALGEELLFRGVIQKYLNVLIKNAHLAIFITGFIFSAIHFQFYGFVPRLLLGMFFGYLVYFTNSLWPAIFAHFANNSMALITQFFVNRGAINNDIETIGTEFTDIYYLIFGIAIALIVGKHIFKKTQTSIG